jgi:hypothetical protein
MHENVYMGLLVCISVTGAENVDRVHAEREHATFTAVRTSQTSLIFFIYTSYYKCVTWNAANCRKTQISPVESTKTLIQRSP